MKADPTGPMFLRSPPLAHAEPTLLSKPSLFHRLSRHAGSWAPTTVVVLSLAGALLSLLPNWLPVDAAVFLALGWTCAGGAIAAAALMLVGDRAGD